MERSRDEWHKKEHTESLLIRFTLKEVFLTVFTYIYTLLIEKDLRECRNVSVKTLCVYFFVPFIWRPLNVFVKSFSLLFLFFCYPYFSTFPFHWSLKYLFCYRTTGMWWNTPRTQCLPPSKAAWDWRPCCTQKQIWARWRICSYQHCSCQSCLTDINYFHNICVQHQTLSDRSQGNIYNNSHVHVHVYPCLFITLCIIYLSVKYLCIYI